MIQNILQSLGWKKAKYSHVGGGDINDAYHVIYQEKSYFLKVNDKKKFPEMLKLEADGLHFLKSKCNIHIPNIFHCGTTDVHQYLVLEWIEKTGPHPEFWTEFGQSLAELHRVTHTFFGLNYDNYIGSLQQQNTQNASWADFFAGRRIIPFVERLYNRADITREMMDVADRFCNRVGELFPQEPPALLHGDLWNGNFMSGNNGKVTLFDPAVYFGHREVDIAMTKLFGGFPDEFYRSYNAAYPLEMGWEKRMQISQVYPLLVHAVLFGGHYIENAFDAMIT